MSKKKAAGKLKQQKRTQPKYLGVKLHDRESVSPGMIIVRQRGTKLGAGKNVKVGRDHTLYSLAKGKVKFEKRMGKTQVSVV